MNLPVIIERLVNAQNNLDSTAYADCFWESATVLDEGKTYRGKDAIRDWIDGANQKFQTRMTPVAYAAKEGILQAEISGGFPGSPIRLNYAFEFKGSLIQSLEITDQG